VSDNKLQKRLPDSIKEKSQYVLTFGVIATMLLVAGFPVFVTAFFGIFAYFLWKTFIQSPPDPASHIFEFYLSANDILRDDERRWFGFEIQEVITNGELILQRMSGAPPLVYFALGALYHKIGNYKAATNHLSYILENESSDELQYVYATPELKKYVKILRKIEREPAEAPLMSAAVRALERTRRNRGKTLLDESRKAVEVLEQKKLATSVEKTQPPQQVENGILAHLASEKEDWSKHQENKTRKETQFSFMDVTETITELVNEVTNDKNHKPKKKEPKTPPPRKPITEVLHDIYDR
jgi:hypothetical protein